MDCVTDVVASSGTVSRITLEELASFRRYEIPKRRYQELVLVSVNDDIRSVLLCLSALGYSCHPAPMSYIMTLYPHLQASQYYCIFIHKVNGHSTKQFNIVISNSNGLHCRVSPSL